VLGKGSKRRIVPVGGPALTALDAWLTARSGWERANTLALFVSARARFVGAAHPAAAQATFASGGAGDAGASACCCVTHMPAICCGPGDLRAVQELSRSCEHHLTTRRSTRLDFQHLAQV
jgi:integrase/recombinase XerC